MTLFDAAAVWGSIFLQVALLGFQSRNVNAGRYGASMLTSVCIGLVSLIAIRGLASFPPIPLVLISVTAGPAGIAFAIWSSKKLYK